MSIETLEIMEPGLLTTVQDQGRYGYQRFGVPVSGAMDAFALRVANVLLGNGEESAGLEMTVFGPRIRFQADAWIALTGADMSPLLDGSALPMWQPVRVPRDGVLVFQGARDGMRSYLAVAGGIDVPVVMGSRSTYLKGVIGGLKGRALSAGDILSTLESGTDVEYANRRLPGNAAPPTYGREHGVRVVLGPQDDAFTAEGIKTFLGSSYSVSIQSDRMGYRLEGPSIERESGPDIISDGTPLGAVQVPGDGQPIVLLADRGPTGGYTKIATVISADISKLAQAMPGDAITFSAIAVEEAHTLLRRHEAFLRSIRKAAGEEVPGRLSIVTEGQSYDVVDEGGDAITLTGASPESVGGLRHRVTATIEGHAYEFEVHVGQVE